MKLNKLTILTLGVMIASLLFSCSKKKDDNKAGVALLLGAATIVPTTGPGCDRTKKECVISLIAGKDWYMTSDQQPTNLLGLTVSFINNSPSFCIAKTKVDIRQGSGDFDIGVATYNVFGNISGGSCNRNVSGSFPSTGLPGRGVITPVSQDCFNITLTYENLIQEGRGSINQDGTTLRLELYNRFGTAVTPAGHRCENGAVGARNADLTPDSDNCTSIAYVCNPSSDPNYNSVQLYDLNE